MCSQKKTDPMKTGTPLDEAKWIAHELDYVDQSALARRSFCVNKAVCKATLYGCALGLGIYRLNGKAVTSDVLVTPFTRYDVRVLYNTYDVTGQICRGENVLGVHLGNGWYNDANPVWNFDKAAWRSYPKLIAALALTYADGTREIIRTDSAWQTHDGPLTYNHMRDGEICDARLIETGWDAPGFSAKGWKKATVCRGPGGVFDCCPMPPIRVIQQLAPERAADGLYDFGKNISGWVRIRVHGKSGDRVTVRYAEYCEPDGTLNERMNMFSKGPVRHAEQYILRGAASETYAPSFVYHGFRYVAIAGDAVIDEVTACFVHTDLPEIGSFSCSDSMLNQIHAACRLSTLTNYFGMPTDCPHREQNGWTGDAQLSCEQSLMNFDMTQAYRKWLLDFKDAQRPNGQLPGIIPTAGWGYNWGSGPAWDSALILLPWHTYQATGDASLICLMWENMKRYMAYLSAMAENEMLDFGLGDWCPPPDAVPCPTRVTDTGYYYFDACIMAKCGELMGEKTDYAALARRVRRAWRSAFLGDAALEKSQTYWACGLYFGLYRKSEQAAAARRLAALVAQKGYHIDCGVLGTKFIFRALSETGYADTLYQMVENPTMPSYAYWMRNGMTTLCEQWNFVNGEGEDDSRNHHMFSEVDNWFYRYIAGIQLSAKELVIAPVYPKGLSWAKAEHAGISVFWNADTLELSLPRPATVYLNKTKCLHLAAGHHVLPRHAGR